MDYYQTYHFAHVCNAVLENPLEYIRILDEFWGNNNIQYFFPPFNKYSNLHMFIEFSIDRLFYESNKQFDELSIEELLNKDFFINDALNYHNIKHESFNDWYKNTKHIDSYSDDTMYRYLESVEFSEEYLKLKNQLIEETFFILFMNRKFLKEFNLNLAGVFEISDINDFNINTKSYLKKNKTLLRKPIPSWAKKAVFYRDRGICVYCKKDLSGLLNISNNRIRLNLEEHTITIIYDDLHPLIGVVQDIIDNLFKYRIDESYRDLLLKVLEYIISLINTPESACDKWRRLYGATI